LQVSQWPVLVLLLAMAIPSTVSSSAQGIDSQSSSTDNVTSLVRNGIGNVSSPFVNSTGVSSINTTSVVINEVELNPRGTDVNHEWIELYNPTNVYLNLSDFAIRTSFKPSTIQLPSEAAIKVNGTYVVELAGHILSDTAESLVLVNGSGEIIDRTPSLVDKNADDRTWQRIPDGNDEWQFVAGTPDKLNAPGEQAGPATSGSPSLPEQCDGSAGCVEGIVTRIVDGDTLYVSVNSTVYRIDLALILEPSNNEEGFIDSTSFTRSQCLGSEVLVDQDDKLLASDTSVIAVVYCAPTSLNSDLLNNGYATLNLGQCQTSEFASQSWAKQYGC
jgi:hypothetical protein